MSLEGHLGCLYIMLFKTKQNLQSTYTLYIVSPILRRHRQICSMLMEYCDHIDVLSIEQNNHKTANGENRVLHIIQTPSFSVKTQQILN